MPRLSWKKRRLVAHKRRSPLGKRLGTPRCQQVCYREKCLSIHNGPLAANLKAAVAGVSRISLSSCGASS